MEVVKIKCFLVCRALFVWPSSVRQTDQGKHWTSLELESFSCRPADVPHPHVLMAFYGSLESLWLLGLNGIHCRDRGVFRGRHSLNTLQMLKVLNTRKGDIVQLLRRFHFYFGGFFLEWITFLILCYHGLDLCFISKRTEHRVFVNQGIFLPQYSA